MTCNMPWPSANIIAGSGGASDFVGVDPVSFETDIDPGEMSYARGAFEGVHSESLASGLLIECDSVGTTANMATDFADNRSMFE